MMDCRTATEILPWLLNGSLGADERRELETHLQDCDACREALADTAGAWRLFAGHPPASLLVAWAEGDDVPDAELVARHVEECPACADEVTLIKEAAALEPFGPSAHRAVPPQPVDRWRRFAFAAAAVAVLGVTALVVSWTALLPRARSASVERDAAWIASAQARVEALKDEVARLTGAGAGAAAPLVNLPVVELLPDSFRMRGGSERVAVHRSSGAVALILTTRTDPGWGSYRLRVLAADGLEVWRSEDLILHNTGDFTILLPLGDLPSGELQLAVDGRRGDVVSELETFRLVIID
jgi:hypothetical protein